MASNDYAVAHQARKKQAEPKNESRIVIEAAPVEPARPVQKHWPPRVNDENTYDKNIRTPEERQQQVFGPEPVKQI